jgi:hypothetical protein
MFLPLLYLLLRGLLGHSLLTNLTCYGLGVLPALLPGDLSRVSSIFRTGNCDCLLLLLLWQNLTILVSDGGGKRY